MFLFKKLMVKLKLKYDDIQEEQEYAQIKGPLLKQFFNVKPLLSDFPPFLTLFKVPICLHDWDSHDLLRPVFSKPI